jgi:DNA-directed RNA polymerase sigma subunit (sigma70/sigma32)
MITGYINKDSRIISFLYEWREENKSYSKAKRKKSEKLLRDGEEIKKKFGLDEKEVESIFDLLEQEHPDL